MAGKHKCSISGLAGASASIDNIMEFLMNQFDTGLQYHTTTISTSAISMKNPEIEGSPMGSHPLVSLYPKRNIQQQATTNIMGWGNDHRQWTPEFIVVQLTKTRCRRSGAPKGIVHSLCRVYPVSVLHLYIAKTADLVAAMGQPRPLFITSQKPIQRATPGTIGHWKKDTLQSAGTCQYCRPSSSTVFQNAILQSTKELRQVL